MSELVNKPTPKKGDLGEDVSDAIMNESNVIPYVPASKCKPIDAAIPVSLSGETNAALSAFKKEGIKVDDYVVEKLQYPNYLSMCEAFGAEQVDAIALMIKQAEDGKTFILADMAGIGKGRICAAALRYAHVNGLTPVFITEKTNLFTDIYRDIIKIGGYATINGRPYLPTPLIMNGWAADRANDIRNYEDAAKPSFVTAPSVAKVIKPIIKSGKLPLDYDGIFTTYSQFMSKVKDKETGEVKLHPKNKYMLDVAKECFFVLDEAHNAAGDSNTGQYFSSLVMEAKNVMFSTATYAKRPENLKLYTRRSDMADSEMGITGALRAIENGGTQLQEYTASALAKAGQMIRRERSFDNCGIDYKYMKEETSEDAFKKFDNTIGKLREIEEFTSSEGFQIAKQGAIQRFIKEHDWQHGYILYEELKELDFGKKGSADRAEFVALHRGKRIIEYDVGNFTGNDFNFIEALIFSLKADFVGDVIIEQLTNQSLENIKSDLDVLKSARKPVIAVRNTLEKVYDTLGFGVKTRIARNDFSLYFQAMIEEALQGTIRAVNVTNALLEYTPNNIPQRDTSVTYRKKYRIIQEDWQDGGAALDEILERFSKFNSDIPFSPIDAIINKIEATEKPRKNESDPKEYFSIQEVTGRKFMLKPDDEGGFIILKNDKETNASTAFQKYNNGGVDVLLINEKGSTGASAHASENVLDKTPRCMIFHQVELDVNTEVQKRGRINRTGQVVYPSYIYAISRIPSEQRRLLMLRKKLHSLDANVAANKSQSEKISDMQDSDGNSLEDFDNKYGADVIDEYIDEFPYFYQFKPSEKRTVARVKDGVDIFLRKLQYAPSEKQVEIYDAINRNYKQKREELEKAKLWDLQTEVEDLQAVSMSRITKKIGNNLNPFSESVYEEDVYINKEQRPLNKDDIEKEVKKYTDGKDIDVFHAELIDNYKKYFTEEYMPQRIKDIPLPNTAGITNKEEKAAIIAKYNSKVEMDKKIMQTEMEYMVNLLTFFKPNRVLAMPKSYNVDLPIDWKIKNAETDDSDEAMEYESYMKQNYFKGKFVGYKILKGTAKNKYAKSNIEMIFVQLDGVPKFTMRPTKSNFWVYHYMMEYGNPKNTKFRMLPNDETQAANWVVEKHKRDFARIITGNLLDGYTIAQNMVDENPLLWRDLRFTRFTQFQSPNLRIGIRLLVDDDERRVKLSEGITTSYLAINNPTLREVLGNRMSNGSFLMSFDKTMYFEKKKDGTLWFNIIEGKITGKKGGEYVIAKDSKLVKKSLLLDPKIKFFVSAASKGIVFTNFRKENLEYKYKKNNTLKWVGVSVRSHEFDVHSDYQWERLKLMFDYIMKMTKANFLVYGANVGDYYKIPEQVSESDEDNEASIPNAVKGVYRYYPMKDYTEETPPPFFIKYERNEPSLKFNYGVMYLNTPLSPQYAFSYKLVPASTTIEGVFNGFMSLFSEERQKVILKEIAEKVDREERDLQIGRYVTETLEEVMAMSAPIFGVLTIPQIGAAFKAYLRGERDEKAEEVVSQKQTSEEELILKELEELDYIFLNMRTASEYVNLLNYLKI